MTVQAKKIITNKKIQFIKNQKVHLKSYPQKKMKEKLNQ